MKTVLFALFVLVATRSAAMTVDPDGSVHLTPEEATKLTELVKALSHENNALREALARTADEPDLYCTKADHAH